MSVRTKVWVAWVALVLVAALVAWAVDSMVLAIALGLVVALTPEHLARRLS